MRGAVEGLVPPDALSVWAAMKPDAAVSNAPRAPLIARIAARLLVGLSLILFVLAVPARYSELVRVSRGVSGELGVVDGPLGYLLPEAGHYALGVLFLEIVFVFTFTIISLAIAWRKKSDWPSLFFSTVFIAYAVWVTPTLDAPRLPPLLQPVADLTQAAGVLLAVMFFLLFPDGRFVPAWTRFSAVAWFFYCLAWGIFPGAWFSLVDPFEASFPAFLALLLLGWGLGLVAQAIRYHRADPRQRLMTKWVVLIVAAACVGYGLVYLPGAFLPTSGYARGLYDLYGVPTFWLLALPMPVAFGIAMQRYHLFKADLIINRALVYGALTASVIALYVLIVGGTAVIFRSGGDFVVSLLATGLVAVLFAPLRDRLQRGVNRLLYGERDDPYAALSRLGQHLETTLTPDAVLPAVTRAVAEALKLPYAAVEVAGGGPDEIAAETGEPVEDPVRLPLLYGGERVGWLVLGRRAGEADFTPADRRLLGDLARQIGVAVHASRLTLDLQRSRERLVIAREEERRRLRRDLHDGVGPRLAALTLKIETARNKLARDPDATSLLADLAERARDAVADVRRSVHALRPPVLDELGLVSALRETAAQYSHNGLRVSVEAPDDLESLPAAVEVAAYNIAQEAMTNVVRHADAGNCTVGLDLDAEAGRLLLRVDDDGRGPGSGSGVGLSSMRERAEELGGKCSVEPGPAGGTRVRVEMPCVPETGS